MLRLLFLLTALLSASAIFADEPVEKSTSPEQIAGLVGRVEQLEKRIKELERQLSKQQAFAVPQYQYYGPHTRTEIQPYIPNTIPNANAPLTYHYPQPQWPAKPNIQIPKAERNLPQHQYRAVPDTWKPFNFNGGQYYIIPIDEAERMNRSQDNSAPDK